MNLKEYLFFSGITARQFAKIADFTDGFICSIINGKIVPSAKSLRTIERVTKGKVTSKTIFNPTKMPEGWEDE